ncbi:DUF4190 domain-containing protein [Lipingzhangella sp. LS1_29]|uniref:DUF4190 domain-containing protein n=1 Tax=Lipingzhangella rawalii TaxID=2055835 RepID=A0ABU2H3H6_9ACTN|nr:DUF4190 domain-containing protein [Lipingzhangella rawalii]MDS1269856.1 DUF4190 domain-containing protein [Lipingzhangella rawalii]
MSQPSPNRTEGQSPTAERGGLWGLLLSGLGLIIPLGIPMSILGIVLARRAHRDARSNGTTAPGAATSVALGVVGIVVWSAVIVGGVMLRGELTSWMDCLGQANTVTVEQECDAQLRADLEQRDVPEIVITGVLGD